MNAPALTITPEAVAAIRQGLFALASEPEWSLAMHKLDEILERSQNTLPPAEAQAWMRIVMAPLGLRAARISIEMNQVQIKRLEDLVNRQQAKLLQTVPA